MYILYHFFSICLLIPSYKKYVRLKIIDNDSTRIGIHDVSVKSKLLFCEELCVSEDIEEAEKISSTELLPKKSAQQYEITYYKFLSWCRL